jgi:hypothetical protein
VVQNSDRLSWTRKLKRKILTTNVDNTVTTTANNMEQLGPAIHGAMGLLIGDLAGAAIDQVFRLIGTATENPGKGVSFLPGPLDLLLKILAQASLGGVATAIIVNALPQTFKLPSTSMWFSMGMIVSQRELVKNLNTFNSMFVYPHRQIESE